MRSLVVGVLASLCVIACRSSDGGGASPSVPAAARESVQTVPVSAGPRSPDVLADTDFIVNGISLGTPRPEVLTRFGSADTTTYGGLIYPGLIVVFFRRDSVVELRLTDSTVATARGLRIGDTKGRLASLYGIEETGSPQYNYFLHPGSDERCMSVEVSEDRISHIYFGSCWQGE